MRQIDDMNDDQIEMLRIKGMLAEGILRPIEQKRIEIQQSRIDACDTLLDYLHDDVAWGMQEPFKKVVEQLKRNLQDEMQDALTP